MERQTTTVPKPNTKQRDSRSHLQPASAARASASTSASASPSSSTPGSPTTPQPPQPSLSTSEPFLRFPRPQGNRHLANWISSSDPDIMRLTTTTTPSEEAGLSESTYELISGTDSESQDGNGTESMADSVGSLDFHRPDDVHSLAGTEQTYDDESVVEDTEEDVPRAVVESAFDGAQSSTTIVDAPQSDDSDSDEEAHSRSSLEYTQQSLGTPSIPLLDASNITETKSPQEHYEEQKPDGQSLRAQLNKYIQGFWEIKRRFSSPFTEGLLAVFPAIGFSLVILFFVPGIFYPASESLTADVPAVASVITTTATTIVASTTTSSSALRLSTSSGGVGLIPLQDAQPDEWLFGAKKPVVSFTPQARGDILVHLPPDVKKTWLAKGCLAVTASRSGEHVDTIMSPVDEGILLKFPRREAHGVVNLALTTTCRPKMRKVVTVHFGKGIMEEAFEITKHFAHDLTELVPAAAQEAERRFEDARRSLNTASDTLGHNVHSVSDTIRKYLGTTVAGTRQSLDRLNYDAIGRFKESTEAAAKSLKTFAHQVAEQAAEQLPVVQDLQDQLQLSLLDAQVSAKVWWLKATGREAEHAAYQRKAKEFVAKKRAAAVDASRVRHAEEKTETSRPWSRILRKNKHCQGSAGRGSRGPQRCKPMA